MFISTWNHPIFNGAVPSADITEDLLTAYQRDNARYMRVKKMRVKKITCCTITTRINLKIFSLWTKKVFVLIAKLSPC